MSNDVVAVPSNAIVDELLSNDNYIKWKSLIKNYLIAQNLWDVVKSAVPQEESEAARKKDALALHAIKISCGSEALSVIVHLNNVRYAWKQLKKKFKPQFLKKLPNLSKEENDESPSPYEEFYHSIMGGDWETVKRFLEGNQDAVRKRINPFEETALHVAVSHGHTHIVMELTNRMNEEDLLLQDKAGYTALSMAATIGIVPIAECLVARNRELLAIPSNNFQLPILIAITVGKYDMARYLYDKTISYLRKDEEFPRGRQLLAKCILSKNFDIALDLIKRYPTLTIDHTKSTVASPINLAMCKSAFPSGTPLRFWQRWIYACIRIPEKSTTTNKSGGSDSAACKDTSISIGEPNKSAPTNPQPKEKKTSIVSGLLRRIALYLSDVLGIKRIYELKLLHSQSQEFLDGMMKNLRKLMSSGNRDLVTEVAYLATFKAVEEGHVEFIIEIVKVIPEMIRCYDHRLRSIFSYAVECRQADIYNMIHGSVIVKEEMATAEDDSGNTLLHLAGKLAPPSYLSQISGAALQMQRELQWFKEVERLMQNKLVHKEFHRNGKNMTPREYFTENHKELVKEGEKWMKETATSCTFVSALIVTIMFAAAFVVPGGTDGDNKLKVISHEKWFLIYIISDAISLFSSTTSVLMFLGILTSRYNEDAFLRSLPARLMIGLFTLFFSIATMMIAFCAALYTMLQGKLYVLVPVVLLASVPVSLFGKLQYPLLEEIYKSTYGKRMFTPRNDLSLFKKQPFK